MPGTVDNWLTTRVAIGPGKLYANLGGGSDHIWDVANPGRLLLHTDGTPLSTQNPNAVHLGMTEGGAAYSIKPSPVQFFADEFAYPIVTRVNQEEAAITGSLLQVLDMVVQQIMNPTATRSDVTGTQGITFGGSGVIGYTSVALIFPIEGAPTTYGVFHLYKAFNDAGLAADVTRKKLGSTPFTFRGQAITTRPAGDQVGRYFMQTAAGS